MVGLDGVEKDESESESGGEADMSIVLSEPGVVLC